MRKYYVRKCRKPDLFPGIYIRCGFNLIVMLLLLNCFGTFLPISITSFSNYFSLSLSSSIVLADLLQMTVHRRPLYAISISWCIEHLHVFSYINGIWNINFPISQTDNKVSRFNFKTKWSRFKSFELRNPLSCEIMNINSGILSLSLDSLKF